VKTYVASTNAGKLAEMRAIFFGSPLEVTLFPAYVPPIEDANDYEGNASLKAMALRTQLPPDAAGAAVLADDSGLEVDALDGRPGVLSARYAGTSSTEQQHRRAALLGEVQAAGSSDRTARFVCVMVLLLPNGERFVGAGSVEGELARQEAGAGGFGYDPLFFYAPLGRTFAQLRPEEKNAISHRRRAADALVAALRLRA
jgi:XTP/dITP diphosphohydrolase